MGHDATHTLDLPLANRTTDAEVIAVADREKRVVVSKDADFVDLHVLSGRPAKLLLISTGNASNTDLRALIEAGLKQIVLELENNSFLELGRFGLVVRG